MKLNEYYRDTELVVRCPVGGAIDQELQRQLRYVRLTVFSDSALVLTVEGEIEDCFPPSACVEHRATALEAIKVRNAVTAARLASEEGVWP